MYRNRIPYTLDKKHGFGIIDATGTNQDQDTLTYYEDDSLLPGQPADLARSFHYCIKVIANYDDSRWIRFTARENRELEKLLANASCSFTPLTNGDMKITITTDTTSFVLQTNQQSNAYCSRNNYSCNCGGKDICIHKKAAAIFLKRRLRGLRHNYVVTSHPVMKSLFVEDSLSEQIENGILGDFKVESMNGLRELIRMLDSAKSPDYYLAFHDFLMDLESQYGYDAHLLELFSYLLFALFEDKGYREAVLDSGAYADSFGYEERQHRSNRTAFKRVLKEYERLCKNLEKGDYSQSSYKEFLFLYRRDYANLLRYYALDKKELIEDDLAYLDIISQMLDAKQEYCAKAAVKLDPLAHVEQTSSIFHRLLSHVPHADKIRIYSEMRNFSLSLEEVRTLPVSEQLELIHNLPVSAESFTYIMDELIADKDAAYKGRFILGTVAKIGPAAASRTQQPDGKAKNALPNQMKLDLAKISPMDGKAKKQEQITQVMLERAAALPHSRVLLAYLRYRLEPGDTTFMYSPKTATQTAVQAVTQFATRTVAKGKAQTAAKIAAQTAAQAAVQTAAQSAAQSDSATLLPVAIAELRPYFDCTYEIENEQSSFTVHFTVTDPAAPQYELFHLAEKSDEGGSFRKLLPNITYPIGIIRQVCLQGEEEAYAAALEKNQDEVDTYLFEKHHQKFASAYRRLCESYEEEKILFRAEEKAQIEWLIYREENANALAFRVGNTRKYVIKDASDFIAAFRDGRTITYGKDLILTHSPENLEDTDAAMIKILMTAKYSVGRKSDRKNKRYISVSDSILASLFEHLAGRVVYYNESPCLIRLNPRKIRLSVNGKYEVSTSLRKSQYFLNLLGKGYVISHVDADVSYAPDHDDTDATSATGHDGTNATSATGHDGTNATSVTDNDGTNATSATGHKRSDAAYALDHRLSDVTYVIDYVDATAEETGLIELIDNNPSISVKPILKDFKKNIYARFFDLFDVDKTITMDFKLSEIRIDSYFDFEKSVITVDTKIYKDDKQIRVQDLDLRMDLVKYGHLTDYLAELGFADGVMQDESRILSFFKMDFTKLKRLTNVYLSDQLQRKELKSVGKPVVRVTYNNNIMQAFLEKSEYSESDLEKIINAIRKKKKFILLEGNRIVDLDSEIARDFAETVSDLNLNPKDLYHKKTISMVTAIKAFAHEKSCRTDKYLRDMIDEIRSFKEADIQLPELHTQLRDYQKEGYNWLTILSRYGMGGILADDMGLGKTIQAIALIKADPEKKPSLIVCPKSLIFNWISEFARFDGSTPVIEIYGSDSVRSEKIAAIDYNKKGVYVTSYDSLRNDITKYTGEFLYGILDEAQYIKNVHAQKTKSVKELKVRHRFALTGTPIENSVVDLWSIFDYVMPGYFEELGRFKENDNAAIARKAGPFILRRVKDDVLDDLPPKYERILTADMNNSQKKLYDAMRLEARKQLEGGGKAFDILPYLTRLRQICVDPGMFVDDYTQGSGKLDMLRTLIPEYLQEGHRILIFSQFVKALESVSRLLQELDIPSYFLSGDTSAKDRIEMMDSFNNGSGPDVFLISLKAGGTGLNLTGADTVIHLDPWWNVAAENQASDRTHRIGQKRNIEVIKLIAGDSIEQRVVELQDLKKEVIKQVISDDDGSVTSASLEDISFILG